MSGLMLTGFGVGVREGVGAAGGVVAGSATVWGVWAGNLMLPLSGSLGCTGLTVAMNITIPSRRETSRGDG